MYVDDARDTSQEVHKHDKGNKGNKKETKTSRPSKSREKGIEVPGVSPKGLAVGKKRRMSEDVERIEGLGEDQLLELVDNRTESSVAAKELQKDQDNPIDELEILIDSVYSLAPHIDQVIQHEIISTFSFNILTLMHKPLRGRTV